MSSFQLDTVLTALQNVQSRVSTKDNKNREYIAYGVSTTAYLESLDDRLLQRMRTYAYYFEVQGSGDIALVYCYIRQSLLVIPAVQIAFMHLPYLPPSPPPLG